MISRLTWLAVDYGVAIITAAAVGLIATVAGATPFWQGLLTGFAGAATAFLMRNAFVDKH